MTLLRSDVPLPTELVSRIVPHVDQQDLAPLLLVSKVVNSIAGRRVYEHVDLFGPRGIFGDVDKYDHDFGSGSSSKIHDGSTGTELGEDTTDKAADIAGSDSCGSSVTDDAPWSLAYHMNFTRSVSWELHPHEMCTPNRNHPALKNLHPRSVTARLTFCPDKVRCDPNSCSLLSNFSPTELHIDVGRPVETGWDYTISGGKWKNDLDYTIGCDKQSLGLLEVSVWDIEVVRQGLKCIKQNLAPSVNKVRLTIRRPSEPARSYERDWLSLRRHMENFLQDHPRFLVEIFFVDWAFWNREDDRAHRIIDLWGVIRGDLGHRVSYWHEADGNVTLMTRRWWGRQSIAALARNDTDPFWISLAIWE